MSQIKEVKLVSENEDKTKKYIITAEKDVDLRKNLFETFAKEGITIFEMKKADATLEDAFMKLISDTQKNEDEKNMEHKESLKKDNKKTEKTKKNKSQKEKEEK